LKIHSSNNKNYKSSQELSPQDIKLYKYIKKNSKRLHKDFKKTSNRSKKASIKKITSVHDIPFDIIPTDKMQLELILRILDLFLNCSIV